MPTNWTLNVDGMAELRKALGQLAPDIKKTLDKANKEVSKPLIAYGKQNLVDIPMSRWVTSGWNDNGRDLQYNVGVARGGIKVKQRGRSKKSPWSSIAQFRNETAVGAIFEAAGRKMQPTSPQGLQFIENIQRWFPVKVNGLTRVIWKAAIKDYGIKKYQELVLKNYQDAADAFNRRTGRF